MSRALNIHQIRKQRRKQRHAEVERPVLQLPMERPERPAPESIADDEETIRGDRGVAVIDFYI